MIRLYFSIFVLYIFSILIAYTAQVSYAADDFNMDEVGIQISDGLPPKASETAIEKSQKGLDTARERMAQRIDGAQRATEAREQGLDRAQQALQSAMDHARNAAERAQQALEAAQNKKDEIPTPTPKEDD